MFRITTNDVRGNLNVRPCERSATDKLAGATNKLGNSRAGEGPTVVLLEGCGRFRTSHGAVLGADTTRLLPTVTEIAEKLPPIE